MEKINWCLHVENGIELVEPNENLSKVYLKKSEDALKAANSLKGNKDWEISSCYYAMYFALYAIMIRIGIKCEIHACTIEFMKVFLTDYFSGDEISLLKKSMDSRIDAQYYSDRPVADRQYENMTQKAPAFFAKCKAMVLKLKEQDIRSIRVKVNDMKIKVSNK